MPNHGAEYAPAIWSIDTDRVFRGRTWWWWWWLLFLENPADPERPRQFCCFWITRNCRRIKVFDTWWRLAHPPRKRSDGVDFYGLAAAWYYNGQRMADPLYMVPGEMSIDREGAWGALAVEGRQLGFKGTPEGYELELAEGGVRLAVQLTPWTDHLSQIVPTGQDYRGPLGYRMYKIRGMHVAGKLEQEGRVEQVKGTAYFQRVRISSPTTPWFWGIFQSERGDFIDYFMPYLGPELLRRRPGERSILGRPRRALSADIGYLEGSTGRYYDFSMHISKGWDEAGWPNFQLKGQGNRGTEGSLELSVQAYQRATWRIQQPWLGLFSTILHYNEYPARLIDFNLETPDLQLKREDLGRVVGNVEHAWGVV